MADPALNLTQEQARELTEKGGAILFHGVPRGLEVGIDYKSWTVTERFLGFKMVPPGMHIVFYAMRDTGGDVSPRTSFFQAVRPGEVVVKQWNASTEQLEDASADVALEKERAFRAWVLDSQVAPYPFSYARKWQSLSSHISRDCADRIQPVRRAVTSATLTGLNADTGASSRLFFTPLPPTPADARRKRARARQRREEAPAVAAASSGRFAGVGVISGAASMEEEGDGSSGGAGTADGAPDEEAEARSRAAQLSWEQAPEASVRRAPWGSSLPSVAGERLDGRWSELLGEMQAAYLLFLLGQSLEGLEQWKAIVHAHCAEAHAVAATEQWGTAFLGALSSQLAELPDDFFMDPLAAGNFLDTALRTLAAAVRDLGQGDAGSGHGAFCTAATRLLRDASTRFGLSLRLEAESDAQRHRRLAGMLTAADRSVPAVLCADDEGEDEEDGPVLVMPGELA